jgi:hypothetical protein
MVNTVFDRGLFPIKKGHFREYFADPASIAWYEVHHRTATIGEEHDN